MKQIFISLILLTFALPLLSQEKSITVDKLPSTIEEFEKLRDNLATTPEGGAVVLIVAAQLYTKDKNLGKQALTVAIDSSELGKGNWYKGFEPSGSFKFQISQLDQKPYIAFGYVEGATPQNSYQVNPPHKYSLSRNQSSGDEASGKVKVFVKTYGVNPRPVTLIKNNKGIWKAKEASSIFVSVQPPAKTTNDDL